MKTYDPHKSARGIFRGILYGLLLWAIIFTVFAVYKAHCFELQKDTYYMIRYSERDKENLKWNTLDYSLEATYLVLHTIDWAQTLHASRINYRSEQDFGTYREWNPVLGPYPTTRQVNSYMAFSTLFHVGVAYVLPRPLRTIWQGAWIGLEYSNIEHNRKVGLGVNLHF